MALKLISAGMDSAEVVARFASERQALALMQHPAIAQVYDAGSTPEGSPYFVMEHVDGVSITEYCDRHQLTIRQRLELFITVCEGVQHAHQKAILHRDLKPSNVMVTERDGKPIVKIIDFGLAKAIGSTPAQMAGATQFGVVVGTPQYMSPEQMDFSAEGIDTRTDVYSLGIVLYELLTGTTPHSDTAAFDELLSQIRQGDVSSPSSRFANPRFGFRPIRQKLERKSRNPPKAACGRPGLDHPQSACQRSRTKVQLGVRICGRHLASPAR